ncbi:MAG: HD domain-containing protein [Bacteroidales bacterium]|nr:HD domain-containing protein [Candidatus Cryptobacteroides aphodequi]
MNRELKEYVESAILPRYEQFDAAHQKNHAEVVIQRSLDLAGAYDVDKDMVYAIAAYHDTGLAVDRKTHHLESGRIVREDNALRRWFSEGQIETMAQAVEDHRASADHEPRSIYGRIVAEADRNIDIQTIITRTIQYSLSHFPELDKDGHIRRTLDHLDEKYGPHGYLKLWIPGSDNERELHELWKIMDDSAAIRAMVESLYNKIVSNV